MFHSITSTDPETTDSTGIAVSTSEWEWQVGQMADEAARQTVFEEALRDKAENTLRAYRANLETFCQYLAEARIQRTVESLISSSEPWSFLTYGLVKGFREWLLLQGYALASVQHKLSTVKLFARLASESGAISADVAEQISSVKGPPKGKRGIRLDERREESGIPQRLSAKKPRTLTLSQPEIYKLLTEHPDTPQGRRDRVICSLGLEHGMRASELAILNVEDIDLETGRIRIYRQKTGMEQRDVLQEHSREALAAYFECGDVPESGLLIRGSRRGGRLSHQGMAPSRISSRVKEIARQILKRDDISAHDLRASFATWAARSGSDIFAIRDAGGWKTTVMAEHYVKSAGLGEAANQRIKLS